MNINNSAPLVFYSWQSDLPNSTNRGLIEKALERACKELSADLEHAIRVESDIQGESGSPDIAATILEKIDAATVVVADVSIIGSAIVTGTEPPRTRKIPNPNVMVELGYAKRSLGSKRVIMVFNTAFGSIEDLPFDIRGKGVLTYSYKADEGDKPANPRNDLSGKLKSALEAALTAARMSSQQKEVESEEQTRRAQGEAFKSLRSRLLHGVATTPPVPLQPNYPLMVLHLIPIVALDGAKRVELQAVPDGPICGEMRPYAAQSWDWLPDVESVTTVAVPHVNGAFGYSRLFETGAMQYVAVLSGGRLNAITYRSIEGIQRILPVLAKLGLQGKCFIAIDVLRTKGTHITRDRMDYPGKQSPSPVMSEALNPPPNLAENPVENDVPSLLQPALDWIWRAAGFHKCFHFDGQGRLLPP